MTSDRRIIDEKLEKLECKNCGLIFSKNLLNQEKILQKYKKNYSYNTSKEGDVFFFTNNGSQERSSHVFNWILENIPEFKMKKAKIITEIGCGEGNLLLKFKQKFPNKKIVGYEFNLSATKIGKKKGLDIRTFNNKNKIKSDLIISYAVIEHTSSPKKFLKSLVKLMNDDGILILGQPNQDKIYYDIFFHDHLFHFSSKHIQDYGRLLNLIQIKKSKSKWPIETFSLHCFKKSKNKIKPNYCFQKTCVKNSITYYEKTFKKINNFLKETNVKKNLAVFGLGETFSLFNAYTNLDRNKIKFGIEDFPTNKENFPFKIINTKDIEHYPIENILFCVNPKYYAILLKKIPKKMQVFLPFNQL
jgi:2-polyprenyl-3-methyl-5-hydroxy-6-metoxy-1,4-benzoquinol methylase